MILSILSYGFFALGLILSYWVWIRPLLRARPALAEFYAVTDSWWSALLAKVNTIKTKLAARLMGAPAALVWLHDFLIPYITGVDWTPITKDIPPWFWPVFAFGVSILFDWLRRLTAKTQEREIEAVAAGATPAQAKVIAGVMPESDDGEGG